MAHYAKVVDVDQKKEYSIFGCVYGVGETPVPIPNTEVKPNSGDGTAELSVGE